MAVGLGAHEQHLQALEEVLSRHGLEKKDLERRYSARARPKIADLLDDWKMVGLSLGFSWQKLSDIEVENHKEERRRVALLDAWEQREGPGATYLKLAEALYSRKRVDIVERFCEIMKSDCGTEMLHEVHCGKHSS